MFSILPVLSTLPIFVSGPMAVLELNKPQFQINKRSTDIFTQSPKDFSSLTFYKKMFYQTIFYNIDKTGFMPWIGF